MAWSVKFLLLLVATLGATSNKAPRMPSDESIEAAKALLDQYPIIDGHNDFPFTLRNNVENDLSKVDFDSDLTQVEPWASDDYDHTDLPRIREGRLGGQFWSAYADCDSQFHDAVQIHLEQIDVTKRLVAAYPDDMAFCTTAAEVRQAMSDGKVASMIGVESGHAINSNLGMLRILYDLGARYMTLTHGCNTPWADAAQVESGDLEERVGGLNDFGVQVVKEMNRLGIFADISHVSASVMHDVLDATTAPVIFSHSSARAICSNPRNVPDDVLVRMVDNGGVVMINFYSWFVNNDGDAATLDDVVDHFNHIRSQCGVDCVAIGADYNGVTQLPPGLEDVSTYPVIFAALIEDGGWSEDDLIQVAQGNILRAMEGMEAASDALAGQAPDMSWMNRELWEDSETSCMSEVGADRNDGTGGGAGGVAQVKVHLALLAATLAWAAGDF